MSFVEERFIEAYKTKGSYTNLILEGLDKLKLNLSQESPDSYKAACVYIVYKVLRQPSILIMLNIFKVFIDSSTV